MPYYTYQYLINRQIMSDSQKINSDRLGSLIDSDLYTWQKERMREGINYYNCKHKILDKRKYYYVDGVKTENVSAANHKIVHPFFRYLNNQKTSYICAKPIGITTAEPDVEDSNNPTPEEQKAIDEAQEFQDLLLEQLGDRFNNKMIEWVSYAGKAGVGIIHFYIDTEGNLQYTIIPAEECILIYDTQYQDKLVGVVRYYTYEFVGNDGQLKNLYKVEYWTEKDVTYWEQQEDRTYILDTLYNINPAGHFYKFNTSTPGTVEQLNWGRVPFVVLKNNPDRTTDLEPIKDIIDTYDFISSDWADALQDFAEMIYVVKGYQALEDERHQGLSEAAIFMRNLKEKHVIPVEVDGAVTSLKVEIPVDAKNKLLDNKRKEVFFFGAGIDVANDNTRVATSGVALKFLYESLDQSANLLINQMKLSLNDFFWFITKYINMKEKKKYDSKGIVFTFNKSMITNSLEQVQMLTQAKPYISNQTYLENLPFINDAEEEQNRIAREKTEDMQSGVVNLDQVPPDPNSLQPVGTAPLPAQILKNQPKQSNQG